MTKIDISEVIDERNFYIRELERIYGKLDGVINTINKTVNNNDIKGKTANNVKSYLSEVYPPLISNITSAIEEICANITKYIDGFHNNVDSSNDCKIDTDKLDQLERELREYETKKKSIDTMMVKIGDSPIASKELEIKKEIQKIKKFMDYEAQTGNIIEAPMTKLQLCLKILSEISSKSFFDPNKGTYNIKKVMQSDSYKTIATNFLNAEAIRLSKNLNEKSYLEVYEFVKKAKEYEKVTVPPELLQYMNKNADSIFQDFVKEYAKEVIADALEAKDQSGDNLNLNLNNILVAIDRKKIENVSDYKLKRESIFKNREAVYQQLLNDLENTNSAKIVNGHIVISNKIIGNASKIFKGTSKVFTTYTLGTNVYEDVNQKQITVGRSMSEHAVGLGVVISGTNGTNLFLNELRKRKSIPKPIMRGSNVILSLSFEKLHQTMYDNNIGDYRNKVNWIGDRIVQPSLKKSSKTFIKMSKNIEEYEKIKRENGYVEKPLP